MLTQGRELSQLDFKDIIGGPLVAVVNAQAMAANTTTNFIQSFAFTKDNPPKLQAVSFDFSQVLQNKNLGGLSDYTEIKVPLLTIIPIPYIRVEDMSINFNVQLHSTSSNSFSNDFAITASASANWFVSLSVTVTDKNTYQFGSVVDDTYSMQVSVHAVQDQMPGGMSQVLSLFTNIIQSQATLIQTIVNDDVKVLTQKAQKQLSTTPTP